jgi:hypothetical protein
MTSTLHRGWRGATAGVLIVAGGSLAVATWMGGQHWLAVALCAFYMVCAVIAYAWAGRDTDTGAAMRAAGDERQIRLSRDALAIAGAVMIVMAIVGSIVSAATNGGDIGSFGLFAAVGGLTYAIAFAVQRRRY